jgi:hypothetical protein
VNALPSSMRDIVLDTNVLGDFISQYFDPSAGNRGAGQFSTGRFLSAEAAREINRIVGRYRAREDLSGGLVVISCFAFVELVRKWEQITQGRVQLHQLRAFLEQPPEWVNIAPLDETQIPAFLEVPTDVFLPQGFKSVEWTDAVHVATAISRGDGNLIATTDVVMHHLKIPNRVRCI